MAEEDPQLSESDENASDPEGVTVPCCSESVHIAYRGKADDRLYIVYDRKWAEIRYFQANGLKVFCATCRHRVL